MPDFVNSGTPTYISGQEYYEMTSIAGNTSTFRSTAYRSRTYPTPTKKQTYARGRNRFKQNIYGLKKLLAEQDTSKVLTEREKEKMKEIHRLLKNLTDDWDASSAELGFNIKAFKCKQCGRRSDKQHLVRNHDGKIINLCKKHSEMEMPDYEEITF